jgi:sigma-B regulation protein RsbU (phosphoserine phosphatase)
VYVVALDLLFFAVQLLTSRFAPKVSSSLGGWVSFLSGLATVLFAIVGFRWLRSQMLWRLRNRLIVTYIFIGVIPVLLLVIISFITLYLFGGQFASFVVTSEITSHLRSMEAANRAIATELATQLLTKPNRHDRGMDRMIRTGRAARCVPGAAPSCHPFVRDPRERLPCHFRRS